MQDWICLFCIQSVLPFYKARDLHTLESSIHNEYEATEHQITPRCTQETPLLYISGSSKYTESTIII